MNGTIVGQVTQRSYDSIEDAFASISEVAVGIWASAIAMIEADGGNVNRVVTWNLRMTGDEVDPMAFYRAHCEIEECVIRSKTVDGRNLFQSACCIFETIWGGNTPEIIRAVFPYIGDTEAGT